MGKKLFDVDIENMPELAYQKQLHEILDEMFEHPRAMKMTWKELALNADLALSTVQNLRWRKTVFVRWLTIWKLAKAIGFELRISPVVKKARRRKSA